MPRKARRSLKNRVEDKLDQALADSFPASDPVSFIQLAPVKAGDLKLTVVEGTGQLTTSRSSTRRGKGKATRS